jgi:hypothetical protein
MLLEEMRQGSQLHSRKTATHRIEVDYALNILAKQGLSLGARSREILLRRSGTAFLRLRQTLTAY